MSYRLCTPPSWPSSLITLHLLLGHGGLQMSSSACELLVVVWDCRQRNASFLVSRCQIRHPAFISPVENEFILFIKYQQSCTWRGWIFYSILLHCFVKHVVCVFSQRPVKCKCHVVYFEMLHVDPGDELFVSVVSSWREITELPDNHSSIL